MNYSGRPRAPTLWWVLQGVTYLAGIALVLALVLQLTGCGLLEPRTVIETVTIEKPVSVPCRILPITVPTWTVDRVSPAEDMVTLNRAIRAELEQRRAYELLLEAGVKSCQ
jgi:hypothetical protein